MKRKHHDLLAWQQSIALVKVIYRLTESFPQSELYALTSQMRRAAVSVPANIAEGMGRNSTKELGYVNSTEQAENQLDRVFGLVGGLINSHRKPSGQA